jgi:polyhydroxybutyrate depolymerase
MRIVFATLLTLLTTPAFACGPDTDCQVADDRTYRYYMPDVEGPVGAFFHAHGYRGSSNGAMNNAALREMADRLGMAFIAINADADDWNLAHRPSQPDQEEAAEYDYIANVIADVSTRIDLDQDRLISTGFSAGGMMTWTLACGMSETFAGFVPYSGTFWGPVPETCPTPVSTVIHIHGLTDTTVPLDGRPIGQARQGSVIEAFQMYAAHGGFPDPTQVAFPHGEGCLVTMGETEGGIALCVFDGGHSYSTTRVEWAIEQILDAL